MQSSSSKGGKLLQLQPRIDKNGTSLLKKNNNKIDACMDRLVEKKSTISVARVWKLEANYESDLRSSCHTWKRKIFAIR